MNGSRAIALTAAFLAACSVPPSAPEDSAVFLPNIEEMRVLASEHRDASWANGAEQRLAEEITAGLPESFVPEIECRSTMCGVGFRLERGAHIKGEFGLKLAEAIGLTRSRSVEHRLPDNTKVIAFYLMP